MKNVTRGMRTMNKKKVSIIMYFTVLNLLALCFYLYLTKERMMLHETEQYYYVIFVVGVVTVLSLVLLTAIFVIRNIFYSKKWTAAYIVGGFALVSCNLVTYLLLV